MPDHLRSFYVAPIGDRTLHPGIWEKIGEALLWLQLCWILAGFGLMIYLAFKVFPKSGDTVRPDRRRIAADTSAPWHIGYHGGDRRQSVIAGNYRLEAFPQARSQKAKVIEFRSDISEANRRFS
jgi:hypothetical protein